MPKVQDKGQVVIPAKVRNALGLKPGDQVIVEAREGEAVVRKKRGVLEYVEETGGVPTPPELKKKSEKEILTAAIEAHVEERYGDR